MRVGPAFCVSVCVSVKTLNMNISAVSGPITTTFYLNWSGEKAALGFGPDRIRTFFSWQQIAPIGL